MNVKKVYIKFDGKSFDYVLGSPGGPRGSGQSVQIFPGDRVRWIARKEDITPASFDSFNVDFKGNTPFNGKSSFDSIQAGPGAEHSADSDPADAAFRRFKYTVTLKPGGQSDDPEVRVEEPGVDQGLETIYAMPSEIEGELECPDVTVYELDLVRVALDPAGFEQTDFDVSFPWSSPLCEATTRAGELRTVRNANVTFYYQVQPVRNEMQYAYTVKIESLKLEGRGMITVLPRPPEPQLSV